jgi:AcrR family transcriptional regulator
MRARETRTFTETARRAQIVEAAVAAIAELGYARASFARIAERAGLSSTGLISYHFASRDELISQVVADSHADLGAFMHARVSAAGSPTAMLTAYVEGVVAYVGAHRTRMKALTEIFLNHRPAAGPDGGYDERQAVGPLERILAAGQEAGEFRRFDVGVMAMAVQRAVDGLPFALEARPELDLELCARELSETFRRAVVA